MSRFHVAVHLFSDRSQKMSKNRKNISDTQAAVCHFSLTHFNDLLLKKCKTTMPICLGDDLQDKEIGAFIINMN